eukprot:3736736-Pyramimonas_sp.AAC.1
MEYFEDRRIFVGLTKEELTQKLPLTSRRKTCSIRAVLYYDPDYVPITRVWVTDPDPKHTTQWLKKSYLNPPNLGCILDDGST